MDIRVLVVEDDEHIGNAVKTFLQCEGYVVDLCTNGNDGLEKLYDKNYQLAILDIMLPGISGQEILCELRKISDIPVLMMTALSEDRHQLTAFENLTDDYITKPFSMQILIKRVEALLRRSGALQRVLHVGALSLYPESFKVEFDGEEVSLTLKEFEILLLLVKNKGKILSHETILIKVWGYEFEGDESSTVHTHIKNLRSKLPVNIIKTVRGVGYGLEMGRLG